MKETRGESNAVSTKWKYYRMDPKAVLTMGLLKVSALSVRRTHTSCRKEASQRGDICPGVPQPARAPGSPRQVRFFLEFLKAGLNVFCSDLDVVWLGDPRPWTEGRRNDSLLLALADVIVSTDVTGDLLENDNAVRFPP
jgi:hypothetical protein